MTKLTYREEAKTLLANMSEETSEEYTTICAAIDDVIDSMDEDTKPAEMVAIILEHINIRYMPIIASMVSEAVGVDMYGGMSPDLVLFHRLFEYAYISDIDEIGEGLEEELKAEPERKVHLHLVGDKLH